MSKELFLGTYGTACDPILPDNFNLVLVCLVHNTGFSAAAVVYDTKELTAYTLPEDGRPKEWYYLPKTYLLDVTVHNELFRHMPDMKEYRQKTLGG